MKALFACATLTLLLGVLKGGTGNMNANEKSYYFEGISIYVSMILILAVKTLCNFGKEKSFQKIVML